MKKYTPSFLILVLFWISGMSLVGQVITSQTDSIVGYVDYSGNDSVPSTIRIIDRLDSIHVYENSWTGLWNTDSAKWLPDRLLYNKYDQAGNELLYTWRQWEDGIGWEPTDSVWNEYNENGLSIFNDSYKWNSDLGSWAGDRRAEYFYNDEGNDTLFRKSRWDVATNDWQYFSIFRTIYNQDNMVGETFHSKWNADEGDWELFEWRRTEYTLNGSNQAVSENNYVFNLADSTWEQVYYAYFTYDEEDRLIKQEYHVLDEDRVYMKDQVEYAFDDAGNKILHNALTFFYEVDTTLYGVRKVFEFNSLNQETLKEDLRWDRDLDDWFLKSRSISTYNENDLLAAEEHTDWNYPGDVEISKSRNEYLYTQTGKDSVRITYFYNRPTNSLYLGRKDFFYYGVPLVTGPTSIPLSTTTDFTLYPVPVRDWLMIEAEVPVGRVEVLDIKGRTILSFNRAETGVNLSSLESGIYLVRLRDTGGMPLGTKRIIKE